MEPLRAYNAQKKKNKDKQYKPKMHMCLGNHEDRISRATNYAPELDGAIGIKDLQYEKNGWKHDTPTFIWPLKIGN